jgi:hypothetical protein
MVEFPRKGGKCMCHDMATTKNFPVALLGVFNDEEYDEEKITEGLIQLNQLLPTLNLNLVKGDLIMFMGLERYRNDGVYIFDGENIVELGMTYDEYGHLPSCCTVINDNVPIRYWDEIAHNCIVWFDQSEVKQQCANNVVINEEYDDVRTTFNYHGQIYTLIYTANEKEDKAISIGKLKKILENNDLLLLFYKDCISIKGCPVNDYTLFIDPNYYDENGVLHRD